MITKDELLKKLRTDESVINAIGELKDEKHKRAISLIAEKFLCDFYDVVVNSVEASKNNPDAFAKLSEELKSRVVIVDSNKSTEKI